MYKIFVAAVLLCASVECGLIYDIGNLFGEPYPEEAKKFFEEIKSTFVEKYGVEYLPEKAGYFNVRTMYKMYLEATVKPSHVHTIRLMEPWDEVCHDLGIALSFRKREVTGSKIFDVSTLEVTRKVKLIAAACEYESLQFNWDVETLYIVPGPTSFKDLGGGREVAEYFTYFLLRDTPKQDHLDSVLDFFIHRNKQVFSFPYIVGLKIKPYSLPTQSSTLFATLQSLPDALDVDEEELEFNPNGYYYDGDQFVPGYFISKKDMKKKKSKGKSINHKSSSKKKHEKSHRDVGESSQRPPRPPLEPIINDQVENKSYPPGVSKQPRVPLKTITNSQEEIMENKPSTSKSTEKKHHSAKPSKSENGNTDSPVTIKLSKSSSIPSKSENGNTDSSVTIKLSKSSSIPASDQETLEVIKGVGNISLGKPEKKTKNKVKRSSEAGESSKTKKTEGKEN